MRRRYLLFMLCYDLVCMCLLSVYVFLILIIVVIIIIIKHQITHHTSPDHLEPPQSCLNAEIKHRNHHYQLSEHHISGQIADSAAALQGRGSDSVSCCSHRPR